MNSPRLGLVGASGYAGQELTHLLGAYPGVAIAFLASTRWAGSTASSRLGTCGRASDVVYVTDAEARARAREVDIVLLATPPEASLELAPVFLEAGARVVDLSNAYRLQPTIPAVYGLPELFRESIPAARLVANPGCYPTAAALALAPFLARGLINPARVIVDAASGVSGAGRTQEAAFSLMELHGDFRAYKVLRHQHTPEIALSLSRVAGAPVAVTFTPHLLPIPRGILATCYATLTRSLAAEEATSILREAYSAEHFVRVAPSADEVSLRQVVGTGQCLVGATCAREPGGAPEIVVIAAIDNLLKGAASQAMQNVSLLLGLPEHTGLDGLRRTFA